jgi:hypothetical protein
MWAREHQPGSRMDTKPVLSQTTSNKPSRTDTPLASRRFWTPTRSATRARRTSVSALTAHPA